MPRFPVYQRQQSLQGGTTGSYAGDAIAAPARALEGLGDAIASTGARIGGAIERKQKEEAEVLRKFHAANDAAWISRARAETAKELSDSSYPTVAEAQQGVQTVTTEVSATAPSQRAQTLYHEWSSGFGRGVEGKAAVNQAAGAVAQRSLNLRAAVQAHADLVEKSPAQLDAVLGRLESDLGAAKNWMSEEEYADTELSSYDAVYSAYGRAVLAEDPELALEMAQTEGAYPKYLQPDLAKQATTRIEEMDAARDRAEYTAEGQAYLDLFGQVTSGAVDEEWLEANRDILGEDGYHAALGEGIAAVDMEDPGSPRWRDNLVSLSLTDPEQAMFTAWDQYAQGMLSKDTFSMIYANAQDAATPEGKARNQARAYLDVALPPGPGRFEVVREFDAFLAKNPNASSLEMQERADKLAAPFRKVRAQQTITSMKRPKFAPPVARPDAAAMEEARKATAKKLSDGEIGAREAAKESGLIRQWLKAMEWFDD